MPFSRLDVSWGGSEMATAMTQEKSKNSKEGSIAKGLFVVGNDKGLHTRPSTELVKLAATFKADIMLIYQKNEVNAKSLLGILMLAAAKGSRIGVEAAGEDAQEAVDSILKLAKSNFNMRY